MFDKIILKFLSKEPVSRVFGFDRGEPVDRYYIEKFLLENKNYIKGLVLEVAESTYAQKFGEDKISKCLILHADSDNAEADIIGDLATGEGIPENVVDCFILTQTLPCIYDLHGAVLNAIRVLKPGGRLLVTVPGITQISRYDMDRWGHYWSFTDLSLKKLFEEVVPTDCIKVETYGNVKAASCFLYGLAQHEITREDLDYNDRDYQVLITAVIKKPD